MTHQVIIIMGVSGVGKSTIARDLAKAVDGHYLEADDFHPPENIAAMKSGRPLDDEMRQPWLTAINLATQHLSSAHPDKQIIIACSALRRSYRNILRKGLTGVLFVHLRGSRKLIAARLDERTGHFMPADLLRSQLVTLETPASDEQHLDIDIKQSRETIVLEIVRVLSDKLC